ncbi:extracellular solute-binding protein [Paenibacillus filicis]|uniref:Extracellular solute-binding protein n=1 Tax=Paenibacillus gyeongsangnamensis TaxID=3388067 RepID=A0ABT4Q2L9_9BACL|nr:extracellular solute-binding protein [Paenibacillus filicis]MCZ8511067.1 extracellular solute-binding protein [Paenibacillus filicis]
MKKKTLKRGAASVLAAATAFGLLAGCSTKGEQAGAGAASGGDGASKAQLTLKVEVFDRGNSPAGMTVTKNLVTKWVQETFGNPNNIKLEYIPVPRAQEVDKLNVLMASGDAPDIVFTYDPNLVYKYVQQGGLMDLGKLIDAWGANLKSYLGKDTLDYGKFDGVQYAIPAKRVYLGKYSSMIRQDWLDKLGLPVPRTTQEVYNTLKAFKEKNAGGSGTIPLGLSLAPASIEPIIWPFIKKTSDEERYTLMQLLGSGDRPTLMPGHKEGVQFLNKLYNEGLISPDFALDKDKKKLQQDVMTGKVGMYAEDAGQSYGTAPDIIGVLQKNIQGAKVTPIDPYTNEEGKHSKPAYQPAGMYIMIPKTSKNGEAAMKYLNWMAQKDVLNRLTNGEEGKNYTLQDGIPILKDEDATKNLLYNAGDMRLVSNGLDLGDKDKNLKAMALAVPEAFRKDAAAAYQNGLADGIPPLRFEKPIQSEVKYGKVLQDKYDELIVKSTMAKPADFDKVYDAALKDYLSSGGEEIKKERTKAYKAMKK